ncbi:MAG: hypothetical protein ACRDH5_07245 [bacterium]
MKSGLMGARVGGQQFDPRYPEWGGNPQNHPEALPGVAAGLPALWASLRARQAWRRSGGQGAYGTGEYDPYIDGPKAPENPNRYGPNEDMSYQDAYRKGYDVPSGSRPGYDPEGNELPGRQGYLARRDEERRIQTQALARRRGSIGG